MFKSEKGVSAVEFALIAPLLFVLTFGIIEFGLMLFDKAVITNASREGARAAVVYDTDTDGNYLAMVESEVKNIVVNYASNNLISLGAGSVNFTAADVNVVYTDADGNTVAVGESGGDITVTANYSYSFLVFSNLINLIGGSINGNIPIVGTTIMRME